MFCPNCGAKIENDSKYCHVCGKPVEENGDLSAPDATTVVEKHPGVESMPPTKSNKKLPLIIGIGAVVILAIIVCAVLAGRGGELTANDPHSAQVTFETKDMSVYDDDGNRVAEVYYDLAVLSGNTPAVKAINASLEKDYQEFKDSVDAEEYPTPDGNRIYRCTIEGSVSYNEDDILSIYYVEQEGLEPADPDSDSDDISNESEEKTSGKTFSLDSGEIEDIQDIITIEDEDSLLEYIQTVIWNGIEDSDEEAEKLVENLTLDDLNYYLNADGELILCIPADMGGTVELNTNLTPHTSDLPEITSREKTAEKEETTTPDEPAKTGADTWQQAYANYLQSYKKQQGEEIVFQLINSEGDSIPELVVSSAIGGVHPKNRLLSYSNGTVCDLGIIGSDGYTYYLPGGNLIYDAWGDAWASGCEVYSFACNELTKIVSFEATALDEFGEEYSYTLNGASVSWEAYCQRMNELDGLCAIAGFETGFLLNASNIDKLLKDPSSVSSSNAQTMRVSSIVIG